ncbi:hypothetical protein GGR53DRAFT_531550 [Hypoxylon sp. FL1150]|nr:hypothetical protein GGR53DRAFT_531550 [Hypoxylon sp. FL1150]
MASPATKSETNGDKPVFNARELEVIAKAWTCISEIKNGVPVVDGAKLAERGGYASADSARHIWRPIQKKLAAIAEAGSDATTPSRKGGRKRKTDTADGETPMKKPRKRMNTKALAKKEGGDDDDDHLAEGEA